MSDQHQYPRTERNHSSNGIVEFDALATKQNAWRFEKLNKLEEGAFGVVYRARDITTGEIVAIKKMKRRKEEYDEGIPLSVIREVKIGTMCKGKNVNIINIKDVVLQDKVDDRDDKITSSNRSPGSKDRPRKGLHLKKEIYVVMDFIQSDLGRLLKDMKERKETFTLPEIKSILHQLLSAVSFLHSVGIIHRYAFMLFFAALYLASCISSLASSFQFHRTYIH